MIKFAFSFISYQLTTKHYNPNSTVFNVVNCRQILQSLSPELKRIRSVEIWVISLPRPNTSDQILLCVVGFNEHVQFLTSPRGCSVHGDSDIDDRHPMKPGWITSVRDLSDVLGFEAGCVEREVDVVYHVVDVGPNSVERQIIRDVVLLHFKQIGAGFVAPFALVEAGAPERVEHPLVDVVVVALDRGFRAFVAEEELQLELAV